MSLLTTITQKVSGVLSPGEATPGGSDIMDVVANLINNPQTGGLQGLISAFQEKGLGAVISSWIGTGDNLPISSEQLQSVLGSERVLSVAQQLGVSTDDAASKLATLLPEVINQLSPTGALPEGGMIDKAMDLVKKMMH